MSNTRPCETWSGISNCQDQVPHSGTETGPSVLPVFLTTLAGSTSPLRRTKTVCRNPDGGAEISPFLLMQAEIRSGFANPPARFATNRKARPGGSGPFRFRLARPSLYGEVLPPGFVRHCAAQERPRGRRWQPLNRGPHRQLPPLRRVHAYATGASALMGKEGTAVHGRAWRPVAMPAARVELERCRRVGRARPGRNARPRPVNGQRNSRSRSSRRRVNE
jgi:hypothetical protein